MKKYLSFFWKHFLLILVASSFLVGCVPLFQRISNKTVVQVNDHTLNTKEFSNLLARRLKDLDALSAKDPGNVERAKKEIIKDFITKSLIADFARSQKISVSESDLDQEIEKIRSSYPDDLSFRRELAKESLSFAEWREQIQTRLLETLVFAKINEKTKPVAEADLKLLYEQKKDSFKKKERILIRQIVSEEEAKSEYIKNDLKKKSFEDLAKRYSITPEGKEGGLVGWIEKGSVDFYDDLFSKPIGQVLGPIKTPFGFHLIRVEKKLPAGVLGFDEVKNQLLKEINAKKEQAAFISWLDSQLRASHVLKDQETINSMKIETRKD